MFSVSAVFQYSVDVPDTAGFGSERCAAAAPHLPLRIRCLNAARAPVPHVILSALQPADEAGPHDPATRPCLACTPGFLLWALPTRGDEIGSRGIGCDRDGNYSPTVSSERGGVQKAR
jgi:hypothetical protein